MTIPSGQTAPVTSVAGAPSAAPNEGVPPDEKSPKKWFQNERIQLPENWPNDWFDNDRNHLADEPGFHIFGDCPSCHHPTTGLCATEYLSQDIGRGAARARVVGVEPIEEAQVVQGIEGPTPDKTQITVLRCACNANHVPPTAGAFGCGSEWLVRVSYDSTSKSNATISVVTQDEASHCWSAADAAAASVPTSLTIAQATAKNWGGALTAILALLGISSLLSNRTSVQSLAPWWQALFGLFALVAVVADGVMLSQSNLATYGFPSIKTSLKPRDLENADLNPLIQASASVGKLQTSVRATAVAVVSALVALAILLFASPAPGPASSKITYTAGRIATTTACGTVTLPKPAAAGQPKPTTLTFTPHTKGAKAQEIELGKITTISAC